MSDSNHLREQAQKCRSFAAMAGDDEIGRKLLAIADEYEAKATQADAKGPISKT